MAEEACCWVASSNDGRWHFVEGGQQRHTTSAILGQCMLFSYFHAGCWNIKGTIFK